MITNTKMYIDETDDGQHLVKIFLDTKEDAKLLYEELKEVGFKTK
jgi:hypothetical protein